MTTVADVSEVLEQLAPLRLAEDWDNVGLLVGDSAAPVERVMTCLTLTPYTVQEAVERGANLVVSHHPLPFRPVQRITSDAVEGALLLQLLRASVAVYSAHTAFDSASAGINSRLAEGLGLTDPAPLMPDADDPQLGAGRAAFPSGPMTLDALVAAARAMLDAPSMRVVGASDQRITKVGIACGSGASMLDAAVAAGCDAFVTGEASFHSCLAAEARGVALLLLGHYASERFAVEALANDLSASLSTLEIWPCQAEHDPLRAV